MNGRPFDQAAFDRYLKDAEQIEGWFYPADMLSFVLLNEVQRNMGMRGHLCEVGVWQGKSLVLLSLLRGESERLLGLDLFPRELRAQTEANLQRFGVATGVELVTADTANLDSQGLRPQLGEGLRFLHIDAGHEYHEVLHQLTLFAPYVMSGGVIALDDYQDREFPGIAAAALDFSERDRPRRFVPFFAAANKMFLCERHHAAAYQRSLLRMPPVATQSRVTRMRDFSLLVGFSKRPTPAAQSMAFIEQADFPAWYDQDDKALALAADRFAQLRMGSLHGREG